MASGLPLRPLGPSGLRVSALSLGSWRTYERIPRQDGLAVMAAARAAGITFLDDARYNDETGRAPIPTGYSEVVFGELFRAAGWRRDEVVIANKLWWEFWPEQSAAAELDGSLGRMALDHIDLAYAATPPDGLGLEALIGEAAALIDSGMRVVASSVLAGGALSGKYASPGASGRLADELGDPRHEAALRAAMGLRSLASRLGTDLAPLAIAFALANPLVCSVLFGATSPAQVTGNLHALQVLAELDADQLAALRLLGDRSRAGQERGAPS